MGIREQLEAKYSKRPYGDSSREVQPALDLTDVLAGVVMLDELAPFEESAAIDALTTRVDELPELIMSPAEIMLRAQGLLTQNFDRQLVGTTTVMVAQRQYSQLVPLRAGEVVEYLHCRVNVIGVNMKFAKMGLYTGAGVKVGTTADHAVDMQSLGHKNFALVAPYTVPVTGGYYIAILVDINGGGTLPQLIRGNSIGTSGQGAIPGGGLVPFIDQSTLAELTNQLDFANPAAGLAYWVGASGDYAS